MYEKNNFSLLKSFDLILGFFEIYEFFLGLFDILVLIKIVEVF